MAASYKHEAGAQGSGSGGVSTIEYQEEKDNAALGTNASALSNVDDDRGLSTSRSINSTTIELDVQDSAVESPAPIEFESPFQPSPHQWTANYSTPIGVSARPLGNGSGTASRDSSFLRGLVKQPSNNPPTDQTRHQAVLLRYYIENLARWFDLCDPKKHFELVVPQRARTCPPLMNAVLTASARHLTTLKKYNADPRNLYYEGHSLSGINKETALHYHDQCIKDLILFSMDPDQTRNENLLAAAIILRFYEEVDAPLRHEERDSEVYLRVTNIFINAHLPAVSEISQDSPLTHSGIDTLMDADPHFISSPVVSTSSSSAFVTPSNTQGSDCVPHVLRADGLRQACFWVAFRQEIYSAFLKQRPFNLSLSRCEGFRSLNPTTDAVWANRLIVFCADVLQLCYGVKTDDGKHWEERWWQFRHREQTWGEVLPVTFEPIHFRDPDRDAGEVWPEICYVADCHVTGVQHVELARILLAVYDPTRPRLGPGHVAGMKALRQELKAIVLRLCGIACSNRRTSPGLITAFIGIAMCGEHFEDVREQQALLRLLDELEGHHAWPVGNTRDNLKHAWGWL